MSAVQYNRPRAIQQQRYVDNPYADVLGLIGTIMGQNANQRNEAGKVSALDPIVNGQGGLLSGATMPDTNFAPQYAPQQTQQQNFGIGQQPQPAQQNMGQGLLGSTAFSYQPQSQPQAPQQPSNDQQSQFDAAVQANPEWYRQGVNPASKVYVGDRPDIANNATVTESGKAVDLTPTPVTEKSGNSYLSAPVKTDIAKQYKQMGASAINELVTKRGMSAKDAIATVQDAINKRTEEDYTAKANTYSDQLHGQLDDVTNMDFSTNANKSKAMGKIMQLNYGLQKIGRPGVDMAAIRELMAVNDLKIDKVDTGDGIQYIGHSSDGSRVVPIGEKMMKGNSPDAVLSAETARRGQDLSYSSTMAGIGARGADSHYIQTPLGPMTTLQVMQEYTKAKGETVQQDDGFGNMKTKIIPPNQELLRILEPIVKGSYGGGGQQESSSNASSPKDAFIQGAMSQFGLTPDQAAQEWDKRQAPQQTPSSRGSYTGNDYLGF